MCKMCNKSKFLAGSIKNLLLKVRVDKLLLEHVGLPHVLALAVHLVNFFSWVSQRGHSEQHFFCTLLPERQGGVGWGGWPM